MTEGTAARSSWDDAKASAFERSRLYSLDQVGQKCAGCQCDRGSGVVEIQWARSRSKFHASGLQLLEAAVGHLPLPFRTETIVYSTFHAECPSCRISRHIRRSFGLAVEAFGVILIFLSVFVALGSAMTPLFFTLTPAQRWLAWGVAFAALLLVPTASLIEAGASILSVPARFRVARLPRFSCHRMIPSRLAWMETSAGRVRVIVPKFRPSSSGLSSSAVVAIFSAIAAAIVIFIGWIANGVSTNVRQDCQIAAYVAVPIVLLATFVTVRRRRAKVRQWTEGFVRAAVERNAAATRPVEI